MTSPATPSSCPGRQPSGQIPETSIIPQLGRIFQEMTYRCMQKWKLMPNVAMVMGHLKMHPEACEPAAIAEAKRFPRQTVTFILDTLEKRGLARRRPHPSDRRRKTVHLTAKGKRLAQSILEDFLLVEKNAAADLGNADLEMVRNLLYSFADSIGNMNTRDFETSKG